MFTVAFAKGAFERAVKTFAQALAAFIVADFASILDVPWETALGVAGLAAVTSLLTSIGNPDFVAGPEPVKGEPFAAEDFSPEDEDA